MTTATTAHQLLNLLTEKAGFSTRVTRDEIDSRFASAVDYLCDNEDITPTQLCRLKAIFWGIKRAIVTLRISSDLDWEIRNLSGRNFLKVICYMYAAGINCEADALTWLRENEGSLLKIARKRPSRKKPSNNALIAQQIADRENTRVAIVYKQGKEKAYFRGSYDQLYTLCMRSVVDHFVWVYPAA